VLPFWPSIPIRWDFHGDCRRTAYREATAERFPGFVPLSGQPRCFSVCSLSNLHNSPVSHLQEFRYMAMVIMDHNVVVRIRAVMHNFRGIAMGQMSVVQPIDTVELEQFSLTPLTRPISRSGCNERPLTASVKFSP
jgi:hypothetical protein